MKNSKVSKIDLHINFSDTYISYVISNRGKDQTTESHYETHGVLTQTEIDNELSAIHSKIRETIKDIRK